MGGTVQKVLQRRSSQKGHGVRVKGVLLPSLLALSYVGLVFNLPLTNPWAWFVFSLIPSALYSYFYFLKHQKRHTLEVLVSFALLIAGCIQALNYAWLHVVYVPLLIAVATFCEPKVVIPLSLLIPFLEMRHFRAGFLQAELSFNGALVLSGALVSLVFSRIRKERDRIKRSFDSLKEEAESIDVNTPADIISSEGLVSQHLSVTNETNEDIREILLLARHVISADSANMFLVRGNSLQLRCSSESSVRNDIPIEELAASCIGKKQLVAFNGRTDPLSSHLAAPLMDGTYAYGMLTLHRSRPFAETEGKTAEMFARQAANLFRRRRLYSQLRKEHLMLKKLKEGGSRLISSLNTEDIALSLIEAAYSIAPQERVSIALLAPRDEGFEIIRQIGFQIPERTSFDLANTRLGLVSRSREPDYISDLRNERSAVLPFKISGEGSLLMLPLSYEKELLGILVFLSPASNALRPYQIELLKVLGNQAASSLANAKFHAEIEQMALTDGLTGLFNHRNFQERLSAEFKRLQRFPEPFSLLLVDIDYFKKINDLYGHPAGDEVLRNIAGIIRETVRDVDVPARYGGEEFAAVLLGTSHDGALNLAERLRTSIGNRRFNLDGKDVRVTVSIGVATAPYDTGDKEGLVEKADQALYHAKRNGRNRCVLWRDIRKGE